MNKSVLKAVLFDMDGVLFDSMPAHAKAWTRVMTEFGFDFTITDAYMHEGRTGNSTIQLIAERQGRTVTDEEIEHIYTLKSAYFDEYPAAKPMVGALELLRKIEAEGRMVILVTGSGTASLLSRLNQYYPGLFEPERMVTAFDVKKGKPDPEPYLMGLAKGSAVLGHQLHADECVVVENAPLGIRAAVAAGIPTIAVNTGPLPPDILSAEGASWLYPSMQALCDAWDNMMR